ncbi:MAG: hypothetical protein JW730_10890 [Anaerolineales bacterium]|nr:hypothetical protein [Anaerolineales bacterium]
MKKTVVVASIFAILLSACSQIPGFSPTPAAGPTVDTAGTSDAQFQTAVVQSLTAQPTLPADSAIDTAVLPVEPSATDTAIETFTPFATVAPFSDLTTTPATATSGPEPSATGPANGTTTATLASNPLTASPTLGIRKYGTQPPEVPFAHVILVNKAKAEAYISLQVTMPDGKYSIIEYPVEGTIKIKAPVGSYLYVAWVGGNKMIGNFRLHTNEDIVITLYKDKVTVK